MSSTSATAIPDLARAFVPRVRIAAGYLALYLLLDWASYVEPLPHTGITPWNPNTGVLMALLLLRGARWAPLAAFGIFAGELLTDVAPPPWRVLTLTSTYLAGVYACAAWALRRRGFERSIDTPRAAAWFAAAVGLAAGCAATGYVGILESTGQLRADETWGAIARYWIGEFSGIVALTPVLLLKIDYAAWSYKLGGSKRKLIMPALGAVFGVTLAFALAAAHDVRLFYPLFAPVTWVALRYGVPGAMISVSLVQAALVAALERTPGSIPLFDVQFPLLSLGITALFLGALATQRDHTLRSLRERDAVLQRSMRFAVAGELASALTHELNQPMTALLSYVRAAQLMTEPMARADERLALTLHKAGEEARRAAAVLRRLREFYRGEGARLEATDAIAVCTRVTEGLQDRMRRSGVEFKLRAPGTLPAVIVDRAHLEIVIHNLLSNCLEAFDGLPARRAQLRRIELTARQEVDNVLISVDDSGPGIASGVRGRLFEPFVTSKGSGMGLGLSLSRTFLRHQGGDLWNEPSPLGGARFVIRLSTQAQSQTNL
ncbi:MAG: MASE1 domain-containing protein [Gammaproteobacteria bacterium]|nr:MASE1 domain-containing protein [Gammaproteobacteria bacterium]